MKHNDGPSTSMRSKQAQKQGRTRPRARSFEKTTAFARLFYKIMAYKKVVLSSSKVKKVQYWYFETQQSCMCLKSELSDKFCKRALTKT